MKIVFQDAIIMIFGPFDSHQTRITMRKTGD